MDLVAMFAVGGASLAGWLSAGWQHLLYRDPEHRIPATSGKLLWRRLALAVLAGGTTALAFRPDHYERGPAALVAVFALALLVLASTDVERKLLPNRLMYPAMVAALAFSWAWPDRSLTAIAIGAGVAVGVASVLFVMGLLVGGAVGSSQTPFGLGDVKLIILLGLLLGWPAFLSALLIGVVFAGIPGLALTVAGRGRSVFSYGPFLVAGGLVVLLFPGAFL